MKITPIAVLAALLLAASPAIAGDDDARRSCNKIKGWLAEEMSLQREMQRIDPNHDWETPLNSWAITVSDGYVGSFTELVENLGPKCKAYGVNIMPEAG